MKFRLTVLMVTCLPLWGACTSVGPGQYRCASTGNPKADGTALWNLLNDKAFPCGSTITVDAGPDYNVPVLYQSYSYGFRWKPQTGCAAGVKTQIISSRLSELPEGQRVTWADRGKLARLVATTPSASAGAIVLDLWPGANNWAARGIAFVTGPGVVAGGGYGIPINYSTDVTPNTRMPDLPRDIEIERCAVYPYEEEQYGPMETAQVQAAFFRGIGIAMKLEGERYSIHDNMIKGVGGYDPANPRISKVQAATPASPAVVTATGLASTFGLSAGTGCATGCTSNCMGSGGCKIGVFEGATGNWSTLNGAKAVVYANPDSVKVYAGDSYYALDPKPYDATGKGALTGTVSVRRGIAIEPIYAILTTGALVDSQIENNLIEGWSMTLFAGGGDNQPTDYRGIVQAGSTATSLILSSAGGLRIGDLVTVPAPGRSVYCVNSTWGCWWGGSRVGKVIQINGTTATVAAHGPQGIDVAPTVGGVALWRGRQTENLLVKRNTIFRSDGHTLNGKGFIELKNCQRCLVDGNILTDSAGGNWFSTTRNQAGRAPWNNSSNLTFSNNLVGGPNGSPPRMTLIGEDNENTSTLSENTYFRNNLMPGIRFPNLATSSPFVRLSIMDYGQGIKSGGWEHNTAIAQPGSASHVLHFAGDYCTDKPARYGYGDNIRLADNLVSYGDGMSANPCLPGLSVAGNLFWADGAFGVAATEKAWPGNHAIATLTAAPLVGTCNWEHWENCRLAPNSTYRGTASDGGDPGADIDRLKDALYGWSEKAGLIDAWNLNRPEAIKPGGGAAVLDFNIISAGACTVEVFTDRNRATRHADSASPACNRPGNTMDAAHVVATLGSVAPLTPSTEYFYKITQGSVVMVGAFKTTGDTPPIPPQTDQLLESRVAGLEAEAIAQRNALSSLKQQTAQLSALLNQAIIAIKSFAKSLEAAAAGLSTNPPPTQ